MPPSSRLSHGIALLLIATLTVACEKRPGGVSPASYIPRLEKNLRENIIPFWTQRCFDRQNGGYIINFDAEGKPTGQSSKMIVTQARMVWLFSRLAREGYEPARRLEGAELGYRFLRDRMWDQRNGGFYWEVDATGMNHLKPKKHLYGQAFALYALSEYALASRLPEPMKLADRLFQLIDTKAYDPKYGGYRESFEEDWSASPPGDTGYLGPVDFKLMNTHLHLMEAFTAYYRAGKSTAARDRLLELISIECNQVVRKSPFACTDKYRRDWGPVLTGDYGRVSFGHNLENIWLVIDAQKALGISTTPALDLYKALFTYSFRYGFDDEKGGFFESGPLNKPPDRLDKTWWVQAEALVSSLSMYELTREHHYWDVFSETYDFVDKYQTDWRRGEWYETVHPDGTTAGAKGQIWKAGYHTGRSMLECLAILRRL